MGQTTFPLGKLPFEFLAELLTHYQINDPRVIIGPRPGEDAAVLDIGADHYLIAKTDPITFATDEIGWYAVNINANDIASMGGTPQWFMATILLPEGKTTPDLVESIFNQLVNACGALDITLIGGHTEITYGIDRPLVTGIMLGLVEKSRLVSTAGARPGDVLLLTKGVPIEATAIIAREKRESLEGRFSPEFLDTCAGYLHEPGISVARDAAVAMQSGRIHAMHDPTEGGVLTGLWEIADAAGVTIRADLTPAVLSDSAKLCAAVGLNPLAAIASGAMLIAVHPEDAETVLSALQGAGIKAYRVGLIEAGENKVIDMHTSEQAERPVRDEITRLFE